MFSLLHKRIVASWFAVLIIAPMLFFIPVSPSGANIAHGWSFFWWEDMLTSGSGCGVTSWNKFKECLAGAFYTIAVEIPRWVFGLAGLVFDVLISVSLSSTMIKNQDFVAKGWVILRDLSNTFFIFILLYIAISTILQTAGGQTKKLLATLIMIALFMNFSLYITRFVIDVGNVLALEFYVNIGSGEVKYIKLPQNDLQPVSIAAGFARAFGIDGLLNPENGWLPTIWPNFGQRMFVFFMIGVMYITAAVIFLKAAMLFLARVVAFWILMILSPLAFFSYILPFTRGKLWSRWSSELISQTFLAPVFLFFVYLSLMLAKNFTGTSNPFFQKGTGSPPESLSFVPIAIVFLQFFTILALLYAGLKTAKGMSGALGEAMTGVGNRLTGYAKTGVGLGTGAALGATAFVGRKYIGGYARDFMQKTDAEGRTREDRWKASQLGRAGLTFTGMATKGSWDARGLGVGNLTKMAGVDIGQAGGKGGADAGFAETVKSREAEYGSIRDPKLQAQYLNSIRDKDVAFAIYSKASAKDRADMAAKSPQYHAMFQGFAQKMGGKERGETHKEALANAKDVRDPRTGAITKTKDAVRSEYLHNMENFGMRPNMTAQERNDQRAKNLNTQREAVESMSADDVSDMLAAAKSNTSVSGPDQVRMIQKTIARAAPEKQVSIHQAILRDVKEKINPATGAVTTSAAQRADIISAIPDAEVRKTLWEKESAEMRAEILATPTGSGLQSIEDSLSEDKREQTRTAKKRVNRRLKVAAKKNDIQTAIGFAPAGAPLPPASVTAIHAAMEDLDDNQIASLGPDVLNRKEVRDKFKVTTLAAIAAYEEVDKPEMKAMVKEYVDRIIPIGTIPFLPGTPGAKKARESMRQLYKNKALFNLLDSADQVNVEEQADIRS